MRSFARNRAAAFLTGVTAAQDRGSGSSVTRSRARHFSRAAAARARRRFGPGGLRYADLVTPTVVFDLDKVLLGGDASTLFLDGRLRQRPRRAVLVLLAAPLLAVLAAVPRTRALGARLMTRLAVGGPPGGDVPAVAPTPRRPPVRTPAPP